jgi:hypothetical protein
MTSKKTSLVQNSDLNSFQKLDKYFEGKEKLVFWFSLALTFLLGLLLFEPKVSIGGDDSMYINRAYNFITKGVFPPFQGPLYPMVIGVIIAISGVNLIVLKFFSLLCLLIHQWFTFKLFKNYLSPFTLFVVMFLISTSSAFIYYGSATYNETFYLSIQSIFLFHFEKNFIRNSPSTLDLKKNIKHILLSGFLLFLLTITKNIGLVAVIAVVIYFLLTKNWKFSILFIAAFAIWTFSFNTIKSTVWENKEVQIGSQGSTLLLKNPYKPDLGNDDAYGFLVRFTENSKSYLGYHFINIFGISKKDNFGGNTFVTILIYALFISGFFIFFRKSKFWLFIGAYTGVAFGATFFALQTYWNQERLIIIFIPLLMAYLVHVLSYLFTNKLKKYAFIFPAFIAICCTANLYRTITVIPEHVKVISKFIGGDKYYGFPEDWVNYLNMTKWVNDNLPDEAYVGCRKPGMAFIYSGGKNFHGIWKVPSKDPEELYNKLKDAGVTYVIMANIRTNPDDPNSRVINTVRRYLGILNTAYPGKLKLVHQLGENWPAYLYEIHY